MVRWLGLLPLLFATFAGAAEADFARQITELQLQVQTLEARLKKLESLLQNHAAFDLLKDVEAMKGEMSRLRGQSEMQTHQMESLGKRQTDLYMDLDKRLEDLNKQVKTAMVPVSSPAATTPAPAATAQAVSAPASQVSSSASSPASAQPAASAAPPADDPMAEAKTYEAALNQFKAANYAAAIAGFRNFLKTYPGSSLASNAQYWIGYAYYALKDYKTSLAQQQKLIGAYPQSPKVPDALLNMASSQIEMDDMAAAKKTLEEIVSKYPGTNAAKIATKRLAAIK